MKYKVKFRVSTDAGKKAKYSINIEEGAQFVVGGEALGFSPIGTLSIRSGELFVSEFPKGIRVTLNNRLGDRFKLSPGDFLQAPGVVVEFIELPWIEVEDSGATRFLDISEASQLKREPEPKTPRASNVEVQVTSTPASQAKSNQVSSPSPTHYEDSVSSAQSQEETAPMQRDQGTTRTHKSRKELRREARLHRKELREQERLAQRSQELSEIKHEQTVLSTPSPDLSIPDLDEQGAATTESQTVSGFHQPAAPSLPMQSAVQAGVAAASAVRAAPDEDLDSLVSSDTAVQSSSGINVIQTPEDRQSFRSQTALSSLLALVFSGCSGFAGAWILGLPRLTGFAVGAVFGLFAVALLAAIFRACSSFFELNQDYESYFRFSVLFSVFLLPWSLTLGFGKTVVTVGSVLIWSMVALVFYLRYKPEVKRFAVVALTVGGVWSWWSPTLQDLKSLNVGDTRQIAVEQSENDSRRSVATEAAVTSPTVAPLAATPEPVVATPEPHAVAPSAAQEAISQFPVVATPTPAAVVRENEPSTRSKAANEAEESPRKSSIPDPLAHEEFFSAVKTGNLRLMKELIERKAVDPNFTLDKGSTALMQASARGHIHIVKFLLSLRVNVNAQDPNGTTALMWAAHRGHAEVVEILLKKGANPTIKRDDGDRAFDIAKRWNRTAIMNLLKSASTHKHRSISSEKSSRKKRR